jgi:FAD:protein FMN transferase
MKTSSCFSASFFAMGSQCSLILYGEHARRAAALAIAEVERIEERYSRYRADNFLSTINAAAQAGAELEVDAETAGLIDHAFAVHHQSQGLFDITAGSLRRIWNDEIVSLPEESSVLAALTKVGLDKVIWRSPWISFTRSGMEIDFGGIAKEYAADRAAALCRTMGVEHGLVELGGDIAIIGPNPDGTPWRVGISDPGTPSVAIATLFVPSSGVATSGDYQRFWEFDGKRYSHILHPRTGWPVVGLTSATVVAESCLAAGALSTIAILKGAEGIAWLEAHASNHIYLDRENRLGGGALRRDSP